MSSTYRSRTLLTLARRARRISSRVIVVVFLAAAVAAAGALSSWLLASSGAPSTSRALALGGNAAATAATAGWIGAMTFCSLIAIIAVMEWCSRSASRRYERAWQQAVERTTIFPKIVPLHAHFASMLERPDPPRAVFDDARFQLAHRETGKIIRTYTREGAALGFVRDVVRLRGHVDAAQFELRVLHTEIRSATLVASGQQLVARALEDRVL